MRPGHEVADLFRANRSLFNHYPYDKLKIINAITDCRTSKLGGYIYQCSNDDCRHREQAYNSCKNRHCPKCQYRTQQIWVKKRAAELLPVKYFHVVWSLPHDLNDLMMLNRHRISNLLFSCSSTALQQVMQQEYQIRSGAVSVLHTWGSSLNLHPHVHSIVPAGGLASDGRWVGTRKSFLTHVKKLSVVFRGIFIKRLKRHYQKGELFFGDRLGYLSNPASFADFIQKLMNKEWVVYSKKSFHREVQVLKYLGRYTHRIAITNHRIKEVDAETVTFSVKDYRHDGRPQLLRLTHHEFLRRFLLHTLSKGFMRIRHSGILGNRYKRANILKIRQMLGGEQLMIHVQREIFKIDGDLQQSIVCRQCRHGRMIAVDELRPYFNTS